MAGKKIKRTKQPGQKRRLWPFGSKEKSSRPKHSSPLAPKLRIAAITIGLPLIAAGLAVGFIYMEKYVSARDEQNPRYGTVIFENIPQWALTQPVRDAFKETLGQSQFQLNRTSARLVAERLNKLYWLYNIQARTDDDNIYVRASCRTPRAIIKTAKGQFYLAVPAPDDPLGASGAENVLVVLDYLPLPKLGLLEITGADTRSFPSPGKSWLADDASAAVALIKALEKMDSQLCPEKPLLNEAASVSVANFAGRKHRTEPHIIIRLKDDTEVFWGAAFGQAGSVLEAGETEKLASLYTFYKEHNNTLLGQSKYIELRTPRTGIPRPQ